MRISRNEKLYKFKTQLMGLAADIDSNEERIRELKDRSEVIILSAAQDKKKGTMRKLNMWKTQ